MLAHSGLSNAARELRTARSTSSSPAWLICASSSPVAGLITSSRSLRLAATSRPSMNRPCTDGSLVLLGMGTSLWTMSACDEALGDGLVDALAGVRDVLLRQPLCRLAVARLQGVDDGGVLVHQRLRVARARVGHAHLHRALHLVDQVVQLVAHAGVATELGDAAVERAVER